MTEGKDWVIPGGEELMGDEVVVADCREGPHHGRIVDLLRVIELTPARIAGGVDVVDLLKDHIIRDIEGEAACSLSSD